MQVAPVEAEVRDDELPFEVRHECTTTRLSGFLRHTATNPTGNAGFPIIAGSTDFSLLLKSGPVMISDGSQPAHWLMATQMTADGKGVVASDPTSSKYDVLNYDKSTKSVGGVTAVFDTFGKKFVSLAEARASTPRLVDLQLFVPATFLAVSTK